ncbi:LacI family DNA-binding transcriptional regulator [Xanthomonas phaseoli]|uniref:LacI family DNA-binding transcriptional regulator n=1 Tax=Xanthomonas phaseoli TaxID=1985254 RepID=UPI000C514FA5|nr:LacI family DNA-binding transcriptional regulator [Xanthomonas phaseoli]ATS28564.1 LacI family DNA-binding transcriptional regulator [Xanthomonas phaseoli pv. phaseoli]QTK97176.1 LacI family DNA-binding transcriptional regulator [Xanthomonas phaseoli pv. phaseoli]
MSISINDVARVAGVSKSTVSRALGSGPVSDDVRAKVEAAVRQTGYRPNLMARRLRSQQSGILGVIVADIRNPYFTALIRAVEEVAYRAGMRVTLCNTDEDPEREALYLELMQEERITGLIFAPTRVTVGRMHELALDYPTVLVDRAGPGSRYDSVVLDNGAAMAELVAHLQAQGYRRIGGLFGSTSTTAAERRDGYLAAMRALKAARTAGLRLPQDLALAGFDNERWTDLVEPGITVVEQPVEDMGRAAMSLLLERLSNPQLPIRRMVMTGRCVVRGSTGARMPGV